MHLFTLDSAAARKLSAPGSRGANIVHLLRKAEQAQISVLRIEAGGVAGRHTAGLNQLLLVIEGSGWVKGREEQEVGVASGDLVFWESGEPHETRAGGNGFTAIVVEGKDLATSDAMKQLKAGGR
jgi:quercetin dioxygenase-like cupin family protein